MKVIRITKKMPGGMMRITISGGMPDMMGGGFGFDSMLPKMLALPCGGEECQDIPCEECEPEEDSKKEESEKEDSEDSEEVETIDVKKLGKALKALPERDRNALRKAIEMYAD